MNELDLNRMDKSAISVDALTSDYSDLEYWLAKSPEERLSAIEFLRCQFFDYDPLTERLQRVLEIA